MIPHLYAAEYARTAVQHFLPLTKKCHIPPQTTLLQRISRLINSCKTSSFSFVHFFRWMTTPSHLSAGDQLIEAGMGSRFCMWEKGWWGVSHQAEAAETFDDGWSVWLAVVWSYFSVPQSCQLLFQHSDMYNFVLILINRAFHNFHRGA